MQLSQKYIAAAFAGVCLAANMASASVGPFSNGGFETPVVSNSSVAPTPWSFGGAGGRHWNQSVGVAPAPEGSQFVELNNNGLGSISQSFATVATTTYNVTFLLTGVADGTPDQFGVDVTATGNSPQSYSYNTGNAPNFNLPTPTLNTYTFTATSSATTLTFTSTALSSTGQQYGPVIDDVRIPEPTSLAMLGIAGIAAMARRRRGV